MPQKTKNRLVVREAKKTNDVRVLASRLQIITNAFVPGLGVDSLSDCLEEVADLLQTEAEALSSKACVDSDLQQSSENLAYLCAYLRTLAQHA